MTKEFCKNVFTIPQITGTCWFNALMMMIFYSQNSRKLLLHYKPFKDKTDILSLTLKSILYRNYKLDKKTIELFNKNNINSILYKFNLEPRITEFISTNGYFIPFFLSNLFDSINTNYLTIDFFNTHSYSYYGTKMKNFYFSITETISLYEDNYKNQIYKSFLNDYYERQRYRSFIKNKIENTVPLYLVVNLWSRSKYLNSYFGYNKDDILNDFYFLNGYFNFNIVGINELLNEITFNGRTYVLDSVSLGNFNDEDIRIGHAIAGITCKNDKYVYNGWIRNTNDPAMKTGIDRTLPCELMPFDWDIHKDNNFCINTKRCDLEGFLDYRDLCFSFDKGDRTLIYILKNDEYKSLDYNKSNSESKFEEIIKTKTKSKDKIVEKKIIDMKKKEIIKERKRMEKEEIKKIKKNIKELKKNIDKYNEYKKELNKLIIIDSEKIKKLLIEYKKYSK